jgi:hypothetical protein
MFQTRGNWLTVVACHTLLWYQFTCLISNHCYFLLITLGQCKCILSSYTSKSLQSDSLGKQLHGSEYPSEATLSFPFSKRISLIHISSSGCFVSVLFPTFPSLSWIIEVLQSFHQDWGMLPLSEAACAAPGLKMLIARTCSVKKAPCEHHCSASTSVPQGYPGAGLTLDPESPCQFLYWVRALKVVFKLLMISKSRQWVSHYLSLWHLFLGLLAA